jgi:hypothetical protein
MMTLDKKEEANKDFHKPKVARIIIAFMVFFSISISFQSLDSGKNSSSTELLDAVVIAKNSDMELINKLEIKKAHTLIRSDFVTLEASRAALNGTPLKAKKYAKGKLKSNTDYKCLVELWNRESNWNVTSKNNSSGAYGIPQALPGKKMAAEGKDWKHSYKTQVDWGIKYIKSRYGNACGALSHHNKNNWY